jgi:hypothetical protein
MGIDWGLYGCAPIGLVMMKSEIRSTKLSALRLDSPPVGRVPGFETNSTSECLMTKTKGSFRGELQGFEHWNFGHLILSFDFAQDGEPVAPFRISDFEFGGC